MASVTSVLCSSMCCKVFLSLRTQHIAQEFGEINGKELIPTLCVTNLLLECIKRRSFRDQFGRAFVCHMFWAHHFLHRLIKVVFFLSITY